MIAPSTPRASTGLVTGLAADVNPGESLAPWTSLRIGGPAELLECERHEHLLNVAFTEGRAWRLLCPYDATGLPAEVLATAQHTHPTILEDGERAPSDGYTEADPYGLPLPPVVEAAIAFPFAADDLHALRAFVAAERAAV